MRGRSRAGSVKSRRHKPAAPKRASGTEVARPRSASAASQGELAQLARERDEALEREKAAADVLRVISSSPGELQPVFQALLANAVRLCEAKFGNLWLR